MEYELYYKNSNKFNNLTNEDNEYYVMTFGTLDKTVEFINLCTLYEMIYKIYCVKNKVKKLHSIYKYMSLEHNKKSTWQRFTM